MLGAVTAEDNFTANSTISDFDSIQSLIDNSKSGDSIHLKNQTYEGNGSVIRIDRNINIYGADSSGTILDANSKSGIFEISDKVTVNIYGITFMNGRTSKNGAAINSNGFLTIHDSKFINNKADYGAIRGSSGSTLTVYNTVLKITALTVVEELLTAITQILKS